MTAERTTDVPALAESPAATTKKPTTRRQRETWQAWVPPNRAPQMDEYITRDELLARLATAGVETTEADLEYWEYEGILPRPIRRRFKDATRAVYPEWFAYLVIWLRELQEAGLVLREIAPRIRSRAHAMLTTTWAWNPPNLTPRARADIQIPILLATEVEKFANLHHQIGSASIDRVEIHVIDAVGDRFVHAYPIAHVEESNS